MSDPIPHDDARKAALAAAEQRLMFRMEFALSGRPAWQVNISGYALLEHGPIVMGAPPYAEDPRTVQVMQDRLSSVIASGVDMPPC
jgi:hypothetical protein